MLYSLQVVLKRNVFKVTLVDIVERCVDLKKGLWKLVGGGELIVGDVGELVETHDGVAGVLLIDDDDLVVHFAVIFLLNDSVVADQVVEVLDDVSDVVFEHLEPEEELVESPVLFVVESNEVVEETLVEAVLLLVFPRGYDELGGGGKS